MTEFNGPRDDRVARTLPTSAMATHFAGFARLSSAALFALFLLLVGGPFAAGAQAFDESQIRGYDDTGAYGQYRF